MATLSPQQVSTAPAIEQPRKMHLTLRVLEILFGLFIAIGSGLPKLFGQETAVEMFDDIGWGDWFRYLVGALEILGGIGLIIPRFTRLAALGLCCLMIGAFLFSVTVLDAGWTAITPVILFAVFAFIAWSRRALPGA